jgi:hypothetical protein
MLYAAVSISSYLNLETVLLETKYIFFKYASHSAVSTELFHAKQSYRSTALAKTIEAFNALENRKVIIPGTLYSDQ